MKMALEEAQKAFEIDEVPVGAVIVRGDEVIAKGYNLRERNTDATAHAELVAIKKACETLGSWRLLDCDIYITLEPCPMCSGAMIQARMNNIYFGAKDPKTGAAGSKLNLFEDFVFNHQCTVTSGILEEECSQIIKDFFKGKRKSKVDTVIE